MKITFEDSTVEGIVAQMNDFLQSFGIARATAALADDAMENITYEAPVKEEAKLQAEIKEEIEKPKTSRRKGKRKAAAKPAEEAVAEDQISDADVAKAASAAAPVITPKAVKEVLGAFGVSTVNDLSQTQRRDFIDNLATQVADAK